MENCLFNNPMVDAAKKALTPEQLEDYKRMGEYMYNSIDYKNAVMDPKVKETKEEDFVMYAVQALKAGGDPNDLTEPEIQGLNKVYGINGTKCLVWKNMKYLIFIQFLQKKKRRQKG